MTLAPPNADQANALHYLLHNPDHTFITGKAGTGKTHVLKLYQEATSKTIALCAPTGVAADNIGGSTIHRLVGVSTGLPADHQLDIFKIRSGRKWLNDVDVLVIDEISMVNADMIDSVDRTLRAIRQRYQEPFGGLQLIMFGDLYQLPPVVREEDRAYYTMAGYESPWFFHAHVWDEIGLPKTFALQEVQRQADEHFKHLLNGVRDKSITWDELRELNEIGNTVPAKNSSSILLSNRKVEAAQRNREKLAKLKGKRQTYRARISTGFGWEHPTEAELDIKPGAHVMMLNNDREDRWFNGTLATVEWCDPEMVGIKINGISMTVDRHAWVPNGTPPENYATAPKFMQMPMKLAYGSTIHKSQGLSLPEIEIDVGPYGIRTAGQTYVALSRVTTPEGLHLLKPLAMKDIIVDPHVQWYFEEIARTQS